MGGSHEYEHSIWIASLICSVKYAMMMWIDMNYDIALGRAWDEIERSSHSSRYVIHLLTETYEVDVDNRTVVCMPSCILADEVIAALVLHYIIGIQKQKGYSPSGEWISSRELKGGISFLPAFQESVIKPLVECLRKDPGATMRNLMEGLRGRVVEGGDVTVEVTTFPDICVRVMMWLGDEELPGQVAMLIDRNLARILSFEDIVVLLGIITKSITER
jgi:hypothetical protein